VGSAQQNQSGDAVPVLEVKDLTMAIGPRVLQRDLNFTIQPGEVFFVSGSLGCGKSTLFKHVVGLYRSASGSILLDGDDAVTATPQKRREILRKIGVSYQGGALFGSMTVIENVMLPLREFTDLSPDQCRDVAIAKLSLVGCADAAERLPSEVSGVVLKRAAAARALALDPRLVIFDEPSAGLDPISSHDLDTLIATLSRLLGTTFMIITRELNSIFAIADRLLLLDAGRKTQVALGSPAELREHSPDPWVQTFLDPKKRGTQAGDSQ
jgi:phospholipid/cholesterol/gamma-HCH transport system ATP-binding protein